MSFNHYRVFIYLVFRKNSINFVFLWRIHKHSLISVVDTVYCFQSLSTQLYDYILVDLRIILKTHQTTLRQYKFMSMRAPQSVTPLQISLNKD